MHECHEMQIKMFQFLSAYFPSTAKENLSLHNPYVSLQFISCLALYFSKSESNTVQLKFMSYYKSLELFLAEILSCGCLNLDMGILLLNLLVTTQIFCELCELPSFILCHLIIICIKAKFFMWFLAELCLLKEYLLGKLTDTEEKYRTWISENPPASGDTYLCIALRNYVLPVFMYHG